MGLLRSAPLAALSTLALPCLLLGGCVDPDLRRGRDALGQGRYDTAVTHLSRAQANGVAPGRVARDLASAHRAWATDLLIRGDCSAASVHLRRAEALTAPLLTDAQRLFDCRARRPLAPEDEVAELNALYALGDRRVTVLRRLFEVSLTLGHAERVLHHAPELEARYALSVDDRRRLMPLLLQRGDTAEARRQLERITTAEPGNPVETLKLASLRQATGDATGARQLYAGLTRTHPDNPVVFIRYAQFLQASGEPDAAQRALQEANALRGVTAPADRALRPLPKSRK